jgi:hypothetical protein
VPLDLPFPLVVIALSPLGGSIGVFGVGGPVDGRGSRLSLAWVRSQGVSSPVVIVALYALSLLVQRPMTPGFESRPIRSGHCLIQFRSPAMKDAIAPSVVIGVVLVVAPPPPLHVAPSLLCDLSHRPLGCLLYKSQT